MLSFHLFAWTAAAVAAQNTDFVSSPGAVFTPAPAYLCNATDFGIKFPRPDDDITQAIYSNGSILTPTFRLVYCSRAYFKTRSLGIDVLLSTPGSPDSGQILAMNQTPSTDPHVAPPGRYGYYVNITVPPTQGELSEGQRTVTVLERATGYYYPYQYQLSRANFTFTVNRHVN